MSLRLPPGNKSCNFPFLGVFLGFILLFSFGDYLRHNSQVLLITCMFRVLLLIDVSFIQHLDLQMIKKVKSQLSEA